MYCLRKFEWVKLLRSHLPEGKGIMGYWARLASHAAFRKGEALYCGYTNQVQPGMWSGGIVGLKRILGVKKRSEAVAVMNELSAFGYITYGIHEHTKHLVYQITDWIIKCAGEECLGKTAYAIDGYGFLCLPRSITERLTTAQYIFEEADAWLDLWCHTVFEDPGNAFSFLAPTVQYGKYGAILSLETIGERWGWEKTKVWRFFKKHGDVFALYRLPGNYGCVVFNRSYPTGHDFPEPTEKQILAIIKELSQYATRRTDRKESLRELLNRIVARYTLGSVWKREAEEKGVKSRIALLAPILRAYLSPCRNCKNCRYDCKRKNKEDHVTDTKHKRSPNQGFVKRE